MIGRKQKLVTLLKPNLYVTGQKQRSESSFNRG
jgi:hypothetical protein